MSELPLSLALAKLAEAAEAIREVATPRGEVYQGAAAAAPPASRDKVFDQRYAAIQTKLDKVIRQLDALSENQAKMAKMLQGLVKAQQLKKDENKKAAEASTNGETKTESEARSAITEQRPGKSNVTAYFLPKLMFLVTFLQTIVRTGPAICS